MGGGGVAVLATLMFVLSCTNDVVIENNENEILFDEATFRVSEEEAKEVLTLFMDQFEPVMTYSTSKKTIKDVQAWCIDKQVVDTYASNAEVDNFNLRGLDTLMYIINYDDNEGFALVSADKRTTSVLAIIDEGSMRPEWLMNTDNPGFNILMEHTVMMQLNEIVMYEKSAPTYATSNLNQSNTIQTRSTTSNIPPRLRSKWGQGFPYNLQCPPKTGSRSIELRNNPVNIDNRMPAGCVPVAMAQALSYFQTIGSVSWTDSYGSGYSVLNWTQIMTDCKDFRWCEPNPYWAKLNIMKYAQKDEYGYGRVGTGRPTTDQVEIGRASCRERV